MTTLAQFCSGVPGNRAGHCTKSTGRFPRSTSYGRYMTVLDETDSPGSSDTPGLTGDEPTDARGRVAELHAIRELALRGPSEKATEAQHAKGKLTSRERIELLLDAGLVPGGRTAPQAPRHRLRPGDEEALHRRCRHRLGHRRGPHGLRLRP